MKSIDELINDVEAIQKTVIDLQKLCARQNEVIKNLTNTNKRALAFINKVKLAHPEHLTEINGILNATTIKKENPILKNLSERNKKRVLDAGIEIVENKTW